MGCRDQLGLDNPGGDLHFAGESAGGAGNSTLGGDLGLAMCPARPISWAVLQNILGQRGELAIGGMGSAESRNGVIGRGRPALLNA